MSQTTTFPVATGADDQRVAKVGATYPPSSGVLRDITPTFIVLTKSRFVDTTFDVSNVLLRYDTSSIPDTAVVTEAKLVFGSGYQANADSRNLVGEAYTWDGTSDTDYTVAVGSSAFSFPLSSISAVAPNEIPLSSPATLINKTGYTYLRVGIDGGQPTGQNEIGLPTDENTTDESIRLVVTYVDAPVFVAKTEGSGSVNHNASVSVAMPAGTAINDEMLAAFSFGGGSNVSITPPTGWALVDRRNSTTEFGQAVYRKNALASEAGPYLFTFSLTGLTSVKYAYVNATYQHPRGIPSVDVASGQANASSTSVVAPSITTTVVDSLVLFVGGVAAGGTAGATFTPPSGMSERADVASGTSTGAGGAAKTLYLMGGTLVDGYQPLQDGGTVPTDAAFATATGWIVGAEAAGTFSELRPNSEQARTTFNATAVPTALGTGGNANAFRTPTALSGAFAAGNWTLDAILRSVTAAMATGQTGRLRWRVFKSANADGTSATELTSGVVLSTTVAGTGNTTANQTVRTATWNAGAITLNAEYLFFAVAYEIIANSGTGNTRDANFRQNTASKITTPSFTPPADVSLEFAEVGQEAIAASGTKTATAQNAAVNIGQTIALSSPVAGAVEKTLSLVWDTRHFVDAGRGLAPNVDLAPGVGLGPAGASLGLFWDFGEDVAVAGQSVEILYDVNALSGQNRDVLYNVSALAGASRQVLYDILQSALLAGASRQVLYDVRGLAQGTRPIVYNVNGLAGQQRSLLYNISAKAGAQRQVLYDLRALAAQSRPVLYNVNGLARGTRTVLFNVNGLAGQQRVILYNVSGRAGAQRQILYNILANALLAGASRQVLYDVRGLARGNRDLLFNVNGLTRQDRSVRYDIYTKAGQSRTLLYDLRALAGAQRNVLYDVRGLVRADRQLLYDVYVKAGAQRTILYDISTLAGAQRSILYDLRGLAGDERDILYNVLSNLITLQYDLEISVDSPLALAELAAEEAIVMETEVTR